MWGGDFVGWSGTTTKTITKSDFSDANDNIYGDIEIAVYGCGTAEVAITSKGTLSSITGPIVARTVKVLLHEHKLFDSAILAQENISLNGTPYVDSYDSSVGLYGEDGNAGLEGDVVTNSQADPAIQLDGNVTINGDTSTGPEGTVSVQGSSTISGDTTHTADVFMPPVTVPSNLENLTQESGPSLITPITGNHKYSSINLTGSQIVTLSGNVNLYITGTIATSGSSQIIMEANSTLNIYFTGDVSLAGNGISNQDGDPSDLTFYGTSTVSNVSLSGISSFYGTFYAPSASCSITGNTEIFGAIAGGSVSHSGTAGVHFDEHLRTDSPTMGWEPYAWQEKH